MLRTLLGLSLALTFLRQVHCRPEGRLNSTYSRMDIARRDLVTHSWMTGSAYPCTGYGDCGLLFNQTGPLTEEDFLTEEDERPCFVRGRLDLNRNWYGYLVSITLKPMVGRFYYRITYAENNCCVKILLYMEEEIQRLRYTMSCLQRQSVIDPTSKQVITLSPLSPDSGCSSNITQGTRRMLDCRSGRLLVSKVPQNWSIAASSCGSPTGLDLEYLFVIYGYEGKCPEPTDLSSSAPSPSYRHRHHHQVPAAVQITTLLTWLTLLLQLCPALTGKLSF